MSTVNTSTTSDEIRQASFAGPSSIAPADSTVNDAALRAALTRVNEENAGMTDELLRCYGQLHLVFGVAKKAADLRDAEAVAVTLLRDLGALLELEQAWFLPEPDEPANTDSVTDSGNIVSVYLTRNAEGELARNEQWVSPPCDLASLSARDEATSPLPLDRAHVWALHPRLLVGSIVGGGERLGTMVLQRPERGNEFVSSEMLLVESVLGFGGHVLLNIRLFDTLKRMSVEVVRALVNAIDQKDHYTCGHSERVGFYACLIGRELNLSARDIEILEWVGLLHDVGKIGVPDEILSKPGKLTDEEFAEIKRHPCMSYDVLRPIASFGKILGGVHFHHENHDGTGYPAGLEGEKIPLFGRIIHVADVFDALTSSRSYRAAFTWEEATKVIEAEAGTKLDPILAACFLKAIGELDAETRATLQRTGRGEDAVVAVLDEPKDTRSGNESHSPAAKRAARCRHHSDPR